jgi:phosphoglycerate dehydrogenase-like enzyme
MSADVLCLRPEADFARLGVLPPASLTVTYLKPDDPSLAQRIKDAQALVIPAVGPKLAATLFEGSALRLIQITGAGLDRLDQSEMTRLGIPVANVTGNDAVAEYAVTTATLLLRRLAFADAEIKRGNYVAFRARMIADNLSGLGGITVGIVGFGVIGRATATAFHRAGGRSRRHSGRSSQPRPAAADSRRGEPACAALAIDHRPDRQPRTCPHEARRGPDPGRARRRGR